MATTSIEKLDHFQNTSDVNVAFLNYTLSLWKRRKLPIIALKLFVYRFPILNGKGKLVSAIILKKENGSSSQKSFRSKTSNYSEQEIKGVQFTPWVTYV